MKHDNVDCTHGTGKQSGDGIIYKYPIFIMYTTNRYNPKGWSMCSRRALNSFMRLLLHYLINT